MQMVQASPDACTARGSAVPRGSSRSISACSRAANRTTNLHAAVGSAGRRSVSSRLSNAIRITTCAVRRGRSTAARRRNQLAQMFAYGPLTRPAESRRNAATSRSAGPKEGAAQAASLIRTEAGLVAVLAERTSAVRDDGATNSATPAVWRKGRPFLPAIGAA